MSSLTVLSRATPSSSGGRSMARQSCDSLSARQTVRPRVQRSYIGASPPLGCLGTRCQPLAAAPQTAAGLPSLQDLPDDVRNSVVVLETKNPSAPGGTTSVYVLGVSHVAKSDCSRIERLIEAVGPEVVMVELCKDRTGLLVDNSFGSSGIWHTNKVVIQGLPQGRGWPSQEHLTSSLLKTVPGASVEVATIEDDCTRLAATGLFRTVKPVISPPGPLEAPNFRPVVLPSGKERMQAVEPFGTVSFQVAERILPAVQECSVQLASGIAEGPAEKVAAGLVAACKDGVSAVSASLAARAELMEAAAEAGLGQVDVEIQGLDTGKATLILRVLEDGAKPAVSGLEGSAVDGTGWGIEPLKRKVPAGSKTPPETFSSFNALQPCTDWKQWEASETACVAPAIPKDGIKEAFGTAVTRAYATLQADAGRTAGIPPGAAWQAALKQSAAQGVQQFHLGDCPTDVSRRRLASGIFDKVAGPAIGSAGLVVATAAACAAGVLSEAPVQAGALAASLTATGVALWPLLGPLLEVSQFAKLSAAEIEEVVRVKKPLTDETSMLKLWGEDAIIDFPGAKGSIIDDRDMYMAQTLHAAATGVDPVSPAYVLSSAVEDDSHNIYRYVMPAGSPPRGGCPSGAGDGTYTPLEGVTAVVGVVGTAHVHGIRECWEKVCQGQAPRQSTLEDLLKIIG